MNGYTKLFNSIVTSSIWAEDDKTRIVWVTILALADQHGEVHAAVPGLARIASVPLEDCQRAIEKLLAPDPYSRTPDCDGRRIEKIDGGWAVINYAKYRRMASDIDRREKATERKRRQRDRHTGVTLGHATSHAVTSSHATSHAVTSSHATSHAVTPSHACVTPELPIAEADSEAEADSKTKPINPLTPLQGDLELFRLRVGSMFNRRPSTQWSDKELKLLKNVFVLETPEEDIALLEQAYKSNDPYLRRDVKTLLNNWNSEIDRCRRPKNTNGHQNTRNGCRRPHRNDFIDGADDVARRAAEAPGTDGGGVDDLPFG